MRTDDIARDLLERNNANLTSALLHACSLLNNARSRVEECLPDKGMGARDLALLWSDLHPFKAAPNRTSTERETDNRSDNT